MSKKLKLSILSNTLAICQLEPGSEIPSWVHASSFFSINRTPEELSIVCDQALVPPVVKRQENWRAFKVEGPLDFSLTGIVASISKVLADSRIPIFVISTYDTDYILVQMTHFDQAATVLRSSFTLE